MIKLPLFLVTALLCIACNGSQQPKAGSSKPAYFWLPRCSADSIDFYRQQARQGNGKAYLKLACCYHDGTGVQRDYLTTEALAGLSTAATGITIKEFFAKLPESDDYRLIHRGIEAALANDDENAWLSLSALESQGYDSEAEVIRCFRADTTTDRHMAFRHFYRTASTKDCTLKQAFACMAAIDAGDYAYAIRRLPRLAETSPALWESLGNLYTRHSTVRNDSLAAQCFAKADSLALLSPTKKRWLEHYRHQEK